VSARVVSHVVSHGACRIALILAPADRACRKYVMSERTGFVGLACVALFVLCFWCGHAAAHQVNLSTARITVGADRVVDVDVAMKGSDVDRVAGTSVYDTQTGLVRPDALAAVAAKVADYVATHSAVLAGEGRRCGSDPGTVSPDADGVTVHTRWSCAEESGRLQYRSTVLVDIAPDAHQVVLIRSGDKTFQDLLDVNRTETVLTEAPQPTTVQVVGLYLEAGIEHILIGYDHIAFLIAIVLWADRLWPVVKLVTAFTVGHSITLSLAALDIVRIPSSIIEPAIAASIVYVAAENFFSHDVQKRWRDTFGFGLVHGFGFASALQEFGIPKSALIPALASFNIGVEIGQIAIVAAVIPLLMVFDRLVGGRVGGGGRDRTPVAVYALSAVIVLLGSYWFLARTVFQA
jgi:hydrogenase/urease accessory protein HupE